MMFFDDEIKKEIPESSFMRPGDEIISIHEVCLNDKYDRKDSRYNSEPLLSSSGKNDLFRDGFFPESLDQQQARFAWTEEDGNIAALVSEPGFGTTGQTTFGKDLDAALKREMKEVDTSCGVFQHTVTQKNGFIFSKKPGSLDSHIVSSTSSETLGLEKSKSRGACKVDKADPRSRFHYVKYVKRHGRTVKLWECGICSREFQHQYTLMRHLPTHTDERNFHCDTCGKSFRQLSTLSQHRAIHSADRPYSCEVCNKTFNRVSTLISHRRTHSDDKPYKCHICPKGFHQKGNLRNHLFTHTNERPYRCNVCFKGFNQQSNLVCHKNKAHSGNNCTVIPRGSNNSPPPTRHLLEMSNSNKSAEDCEVSSSIGPYLPSMEGPSTSSWPKSWETPKAYPKCGDIWNSELSGSPSSGVIVDPIKTYHMEVAVATKQTPFALLKPDNGTPVLVKVVDTKLPGGKQMLVPATAEDLRVGGKIVVENEDAPQTQNAQVDANMGVQIRVPVVATVVPKINSSGRLHLSVEEPHHAYHTALSAEVGEVKVEPCTVKEEPQGSEPRHRLETCSYDDNTGKLAGRASSSCVLLQSPPSPPLDLISLDLFEPMECIPMGPQITAVDIENSPPSDDSDIFIGQFEEGIPLSDSD